MNERTGELNYPWWYISQCTNIYIQNNDKQQQETEKKKVFIRDRIESQNDDRHFLV